MWANEADLTNHMACCRHPFQAHAMALRGHVRAGSSRGMM